MSPRPTPRPGHTLLELIGVIAILGLLAAIWFARTTAGQHESKSAACAVHRGNIEIQAQLWRHGQGSWPAADLSDLADDAAYFPSGLPVCPVDGSTYSIDANGRVVGHAH